MTIGSPSVSCPNRGLTQEAATTGVHHGRFLPETEPGVSAAVPCLTPQQQKAQSGSKVLCPSPEIQDCSPQYDISDYLLSSQTCQDFPLEPAEYSVEGRLDNEKDKAGLSFDTNHQLASVRKTSTPKATGAIRDGQRALSGEATGTGCEEDTEYSEFDDPQTIEILRYISQSRTGTHDDSYSASDETDMANLIDSELNVPPSSTTHAVGRKSSEVAKPELDQDLLDDDVDWKSLIEHLPLVPQNPSVTKGQRDPPMRHDGCTSTPHSLLPLSGPPFRSALGDRSSVPSLDRSVVIRLCFRISQLLDEGQRSLTSHQHALFELYARVTYSSREDMSNIQHFQFMDLYTEQLPYPSGTLIGWRQGSLVEKQSAIFLGGGTRMCRCICWLHQDRKSAVGLTVRVISIRETDGDEVELMRQISGFVEST